MVYLGIDVGTGSARAGLFDGRGKMLGMGVEPIRTWRPQEDFVEQSSSNIWRACGEAVHAALSQAALDAGQVRGIGCDATCSLVLLDAEDKPVSVALEGDDERNVIVWMDHRAAAQAARINASGHEVLRYVGGVMSPEMQSPKLLWLKENLPGSFARARRFLDLPDFLSFRATGRDTRSLCTTVCKWTYLGHEQGEGESVGRFDPGFFHAVGLGELAEERFARIGRRVRPMGEPVGGLLPRAAAELGLVAGIPVAVSIIDAHAGGIGLLGAPLDGRAPGEDELEERLALIGGTSSCHMAVSRTPRFIDGLWGPYFSAMVPGLWLTEGGQSATGALIDHVIASHCRGAELEEEARREGATVYDLLNARLERLASGLDAPPAALTRRLHVLPYFHGNRSPRANPDLRGMISGLKLSDSADSLALLYLAAIQAIAHGTRHIIDVMNAQGLRIRELVACGGGTRNPIFVREHKDVTGCRVILPREPEAVLLGAAILGAAATRDFDSVLSAMRAMCQSDRVLLPERGATARYHEQKHQVFQRMYQDFLAYDRIIGA
ncbi:MAG: FGGY-family carbohydrate kinase [Planctomycetes bacterium]|nr:FGGY-family carbohydrate kinase [Planctomycetota bacterium]